MDFNPLEWLKANVAFTVSTSTSALYERMDSQSSHGLPGIYLPYDLTIPWHFKDRAQILDYMHSVGTGRILDFGPGDGWPSLHLAAMCQEVVGVEGSPKRIRTCIENAERLKVTNASFVHVCPGERLPFDDGSFDGATAASSVEQTPDPTFTIAEIHRVLKPGGRFRMHYESLGYYQGSEKDIWIMASGVRETCLIIYDRNIIGGYVDHYCLVIGMNRDRVETLLAPQTKVVTYGNLGERAMSELLPHITEALHWRGVHPSCRTWMEMLETAGFSRVEATHDGGSFAHDLYGTLPESGRPKTVEEADLMLSPLVKVVVGMKAPRESMPNKWDSWITAWK